jgi:site-specific recombinase XerD
VAAVRQLAEHYHRSPDQLTEEDLRQYFLYLANDKKVARTTATIALCGIRFFFEQTLRREWPTLRFVRPAPEHKLPVVLSRDEVRRVLTAVRIPVYRVCLTMIYACGLRLLEGAHLHVADVDSARMVVHVHGNPCHAYCISLRRRDKTTGTPACRQACDLAFSSAACLVVRRGIGVDPCTGEHGSGRAGPISEPLPG